MNLPAIPEDETPDIPFLRQIATRDIGAEIRQLMGPLAAFANLFDDLRRMYPPPQPCPACHLDLVRLTAQQKNEHWRTHGWMSRTLANLRRLGA